ncbi:MAG: hypothetical protein RLZZ557_713 [Bacteroidota bacterium]|jgi:hypothetical protein
MRNFLTSIGSICFSTLFSLHAFCQDIKIDTTTLREELKAMSSDELVAELRSMLDSMGKPTSFVSVNAGMSNSLFSARNNAFNANQSSTSATAFIPSVSYFHKSGFGLNATGYVRSFGQTPTLYQTAITPSYDHFGKQFLYGVSYSHYIRSTNPDVTTTPYKQEVYAYAQWRSAWLRPSLSMGWGGGNYKDVSMIPVKISGDEVLIVDTSLVNLNDFSLIASVGHHFNFSDLITANDVFTINPQLSLIGGMQRYDSRTISRRFFGERFKASELERIRKRYNTSSSSTTISLETAAFSLNFSWFKGAFSINTGYFMGYYFDPAATRRFSHIFNTGIGLTF